MTTANTQTAIFYKITLIAWIFSLIGLFGARVSKLFIHTDGTIGISTGWDLRGMWNFDHAIIDGINPYPYALRGECYMPLDFDGDCLPILNTPLFALITTPIAALDWNKAQVVWFILNIISIMIILALIERKLLPVPVQIPRFILLVLLFFASGPVSSILQIGQTSIIIFVFALLGFILLPKSQLLAGVFIGLALSKYSLTFLIVLYLLLDHKYRALTTAILTQVIGLLLISLFVNTPPQTILADYVTLATRFVDSTTEFNLHSRIIDLGLSRSMAFALDLIGLAITSMTILVYVKFSKSRDQRLDNVLMLPFLLIASIPFVYHRHYDSVVLILLTMPYFWDKQNRDKSLSNSWFEKYSLPVVIVVVLFVLYYPRTLIPYSTSPTLQTGLLFLDTFTILLTWAVLLSRIWQIVELPTKLKRHSRLSHQDENQEHPFCISTQE